MPAAPLLKSRGRREVVQQDVGHRGRADRVVREMPPRAEELEVLRLDAVPFVHGTDDVAYDRAPHGSPLPGCPTPGSPSTPGYLRGLVHDRRERRSDLPGAPPPRQTSQAVRRRPPTRPQPPTQDIHALRHRNRASPHDEAHLRDRRQGGPRRRRDSAVRPLQGEGPPRRGPGTPAPRRQAGPGHRLQPHGRRRRQVDRLGGPRRRAQPAGAEPRALHPRGVSGTRLRDQGRGGRRRPFAGRPHGGHQPPLHRRLPRDHLRARAPVGHARQPPLPSQQHGAGPPPHHLGPRGGHERPGSARRDRRAGRPLRRDPARGRLS